MNELSDRLRSDFKDKEFRQVYADESLNAFIATQIKVLREQRKWTQQELAELAEMKQARISLIEDINYSSWSINTLRRLAQAFDLRLSVSFETFGSLLPELENFSRDTLARPSFDEDPAFGDGAMEVTTTSTSHFAKPVVTVNTSSNVVPIDAYRGRTA